LFIFSQYKKYSNISKIDAFVKETVNYVDSFYQALNINVILSHIEVWNRRDEVKLSEPDQVIVKYIS